MGSSSNRAVGVFLLFLFTFWSRVLSAEQNKESSYEEIITSVAKVVKWSQPIDNTVLFRTSQHPESWTRAIELLRKHAPTLTNTVEISSIKKDSILDDMVLFGRGCALLMYDELSIGHVDNAHDWFLVLEALMCELKTDASCISMRLEALVEDHVLAGFKTLTDEHRSIPEWALNWLDGKDIFGKPRRDFNMPSEMKRVLDILKKQEDQDSVILAAIIAEIDALRRKRALAPDRVSSIRSRTQKLKTKDWKTVVLDDWINLLEMHSLIERLRDEVKEKARNESGSARSSQMRNGGTGVIPKAPIKIGRE